MAIQPTRLDDRSWQDLRDELVRRLTALTDPKNGERAVSRVFKREEVYRRFNPRLIPDLIVTNRPGYRVSWQASLGVPTDTDGPVLQQWNAVYKHLTDARAFDTVRLGSGYLFAELFLE